MNTFSHLKRLLARLRPHLPPAPELPAILPVPSGGVVRVGRTLPSYLACRPELPAPEPMQCRRCSYRNQDAASRFFVRCAGSGDGSMSRLSTHNRGGRMP